MSLFRIICSFFFLFFLCAASLYPFPSDRSSIEDEATSFDWERLKPKEPTPPPPQKEWDNTPSCPDSTDKCPSKENKDLLKEKEEPSSPEPEESLL